MQRPHSGPVSQQTFIDGHLEVVAEADEVFGGGGDGVAGVEEREVGAPDHRDVGEDEQTDQERSDEVTECGVATGEGPQAGQRTCAPPLVAWQFSARDPEVREAREHRALRIIALSFFALVAYVTFESVRALFFGANDAEHFSVGLVLAAVSLAVMPFLSFA
jgi:hypothetical protein